MSIKSSRVMLFKPDSIANKSFTDIFVVSEKYSIDIPAFSIISFILFPRVLKKVLSGGILNFIVWSKGIITKKIDKEECKLNYI